MSDQSERERELTLKETSTVSLLSRLEELHSFGPTSPQEALEAESTEQELEERQAWESKVSRW